MVNRLRIADDEIVTRIDQHPVEFWSSIDRNPREDMHAFMQYPAMMVPEIQREILGIITEAQPGIRHVLDPFVGTATTMTSCMTYGLDFAGQDINPLAVLISRAKTGPFDSEALEESKLRVAASIEADRSTGVETDFPNIDKWFTSQVRIDLSKIRRAITQEGELWIRRFMWVALAETVRLTSNSRTSTYKLHIRPIKEIELRTSPAIQLFNTIVAQNIQDLICFKSTVNDHIRGIAYVGDLAIHLRDSSQEILPPIEGGKYDLLVTSPPYGDNLSTVPYGQFSYLPLRWIDLADIDERANSDLLRTTQEIDRRSLGGTNVRDLELAEADLATRSPAFELTIRKLGDSPRDRRLRVTSFLYDLENSLGPMVKILRPNAYLVWIIGNRHVGGEEIPTDRIVEELFQTRGVSLIKRFNRQIMYRRMAARNQRAGMMRKEHVLVFRKQGD